ncbi:phosphodiesterase [Antrihabitans sp. YC2-6]|uniref:phosphodiesterase n=1 Tax=Antrihabitans sp. YC2-6 TaxID=2799498 RepID=UPI0018F4C29C|nr:phosphodiesterase [Antrihabitans sp. YC2-6]MBJ8348923.1 phosphodiesterase [Antrihabitans sp. YC2-6]
MDLPARALQVAFDVVARVRRARVFHPDGITLSGRLHAEPEFEALFGSGERAVIARLSKGTGLPSAIPDVLGLAFRVLDRDDKPWDFALATTGTGTASRFLITPARGWVSARYGSLMPYRLDGKPAWIFAAPDNGQPASASLGAMNDHLTSSAVTFTITARGVRGPARPVATISLRRADLAERDIVDFFDPMENHPADVELLPKAVANLRELAYEGSRHGRGPQA